MMALIINISIIAICSSEEPVRVFTILVTPFRQVVAAAYCFVGIPVILSAGVGALYRIETSLRIFFGYLCIGFVGALVLPMSYITNGSLCDAAVEPAVQRMGSSFVCGFTDTFGFFWVLIGLLVHMYAIYIIWSAAEDIAATPFPELLKYSEVLRGIKVALPGPGPYEVGRGATTVPHPIPDYRTMQDFQNMQGQGLPQYYGFASQAPVDPPAPLKSALKGGTTQYGTPQMTSSFQPGQR